MPAREFDDFLAGKISPDHFRGLMQGIFQTKPSTPKTDVPQVTQSVDNAAVSEAKATLLPLIEQKLPQSLPPRDEQLEELLSLAGNDISLLVDMVDFSATAKDPVKSYAAWSRYHLKQTPHDRIRTVAAHQRKQEANDPDKVVKEVRSQAEAQLASMAFDDEPSEEAINSLKRLAALRSQKREAAHV